MIATVSIGNPSAFHTERRQSRERKGNTVVLAGDGGWVGVEPIPTAAKKVFFFNHFYPSFQE
jgi:hypothetical protein